MAQLRNRFFYNILTAISLFIVSILCCCLITEAALRICGYDGYDERLRFAITADFGEIPRESWLFSIPDNPKPNDILKINSHEVRVAKAPATKRILFIGDSGTFGSGVQFEQTFPFQFEKLHRAKHPDEKIEIINAGIPGLTTVDEYTLFEKKLAVLKPDVVILGFFMANDINFNVRYTEKRFSNSTSNRLHRFLAALRQHSAFVHFLVIKFTALNAKHKFFKIRDPEAEIVYAPFATGGIDEDGIPFFFYMEGEVATYKKKYSKLMEYAFQVLDRTLYKFNVLSESQGFVFRVVLIPASSSLANRLKMFKFPEPIKTMNEHGMKVQEEDLDIGKPTRLVMETCKSAGVVCINPTDEVREKLGTAAIIEDNDDHLSVAGHSLMGEILFRTLEQEN